MKNEADCIIIREMTRKDVAAAAAIEAANFSEPWSENSFLSSLNRTDYIFLVAEKVLEGSEAGEILGYCGFYYSFDEAEITNVCVKEAARKQGLGRQILEESFRRCKRLGVTTIELEVRFGNGPAVSLYKSLGFEEIGVRKNFYSKPVEDARIMIKKNEE